MTWPPQAVSLRGRRHLERTSAAMTATAAANPRPSGRDNRLPETIGRALGLSGCWCGELYGHDWPGKADGQAHPR